MFYVIVWIIKTHMNIQIDRSLPVPVAAQLRGQIEYGITYGFFAPGSKLPNVKYLAEQLRVSPITISQAYKELRQKGIIISSPGRGTYVADNQVDRVRPLKQSENIASLINKLIETAENHGISQVELISLITAHFGQNTTGSGIALAFIGEFAHATHTYANSLHPYLYGTDRVECYTFRDLLNDGEVKRKASEADLIVTLPHRVPQVAVILGRRENITGVNFIPSEETRIALAQVDPLVRVGLISTFPEFLVPLKNGVNLFAPHANITGTAVFGTEQVSKVVQNSDIIVFATGAEAVRDILPYRVSAIEYRHVPDPNSVIQDVLPEIKKVRARRSEVLHGRLRQEGTET